MKKITIYINGDVEIRCKKHNEVVEPDEACQSCLDENNRICENRGCYQYAEFYNPMGERLCSLCIQDDVAYGIYLWEECEAIIIKEE